MFSLQVQRQNIKAAGALILLWNIEAKLSILNPVTVRVQSLACAFAVRVMSFIYHGDSVNGDNALCALNHKISIFNLYT